MSSEAGVSVAARGAGEGSPDGVALVSVVIPCFNQAGYLEAAVCSALNQTGCSIEVIVVDDASTDATAAVAAGFPGVVCLRQAENGGLALARNAGLAVARGDYVVFLDADDWLLPGALEAGLRCLADDASAGFAVGAFEFVRADGSRLWRQDPARLVEDPYGVLLRNNAVGMVAAVLFRRRAIDAVGGLDVRLRACEDYDLLLRIAQRFPVRQHERATACYRMHAQNMSRDHALMLKSSLQALNKQRYAAQQRPEWRAAYREGVEYWKNRYGRFLLKDVLARVAARRDLRRAAWCVAALLRHVGPRRLFRWYVRRAELAAHTDLPQ